MQNAHSCALKSNRKVSSSLQPAQRDMVLLDGDPGRRLPRRDGRSEHACNCVLNEAEAASAAEGAPFYGLVMACPTLVRYVQDGRLTIDNAPAEQAIRPRSQGHVPFCQVNIFTARLLSSNVKRVVHFGA